MLDYKKRKINNWDRLIEEFNDLSMKGAQWIFRGQRNSKWRLQTTLERAILNFGMGKSDLPEEDDPRGEEKLVKIRRVLGRGLERRSVAKLECGLLRKFKRQCYHYEMDTPGDDNTGEWLALMRHYGAPARLLDCTYSFFVAVYFALEDAEDECAVWALNSDWMKEPVKAILPEDVWKCWKADEQIQKHSTFDEVFGHKKSIVLAVNPYRLNERLVAQQGVFLCPGDVSKPFEENLAALFSKRDSRNNLIKFTITGVQTQRRKILQVLRQMNIDRATLFPGLDGFAQSLRTWLASPQILAPTTSDDSEVEWMQ